MVSSPIYSFALSDGTTSPQKTKALNSRYTIYLSMRQLNETFEDEEFEFLKKAKGDKPWRRFILELVDYAQAQENVHTNGVHKLNQ